MCASCQTQLRLIIMAHASEVFPLFIRKSARCRARYHEVRTTVKKARRHKLLSHVVFKSHVVSLKLRLHHTIVSTQNLSFSLSYSLKIFEDSYLVPDR